jgi:hypothetical protein
MFRAHERHGMHRVGVPVRFRVNLDGIAPGERPELVECLKGLILYNRQVPG